MFCKILKFMWSFGPLSHFALHIEVDLSCYACQGNKACWDGEFTFERCCIDSDPAEIPAELVAVGVPRQQLPSEILHCHITM